MEFRRIGAHEVVLDDKTLHQAIVEICEDRVVNYYEFQKEMPMTEWLGGTIIIKHNIEGFLEAFKDGELLTND